MPIRTYEGAACVVTGAAAGIGRALADALVARGARVVLADIDGAGLERAAAELGAPSRRTDVSRPEELVALARFAEDQVGTVDLLCNNAGVGRYAGYDHLTPRDWQWMMDVNFWGIHHGITAFLPGMRRAGNGHILNTVSLQGLFVFPASAAYAASKYAALALTEALDLELREESGTIGITAFCPGPVATDIATSGDRRSERYGSVQASGSDPIGEATLRMLGSVPLMPAAIAADAALAAVERGEFWAFSHPDLLDPVRARSSAIEAAAARSLASPNSTHPTGR